MNFDWYKIFSLPEWLAENLVSRTLILELEDLGRVRFEITQGNTTAVRHDDTFLPVNFLERNPYVQDGKAIYLDANDDVWIGFEVEE